jgi:hypothetical protein
VCKIKSVDATGVSVEDIDAFDGSPILDLKPYIPPSDSVPGATGPKRPKRLGNYSKNCDCQLERRAFISDNSAPLDAQVYFSLTLKCNYRTAITHFCGAVFG